MHELGLQVVYEKLHDDVVMPKPATKLSAGMDVSAYLYGRTVKVFNSDNTEQEMYVDEALVLFPGQRAAIPLGFKARLPEGWEAQVRTRSGLALKSDTVVANSPGTIDADYPGEWMVILRNGSDAPVKITHGTRVAQVVLVQLSQQLEWVDGSVTQTTDRSGGFGSTGT